MQKLRKEVRSKLRSGTTIICATQCVLELVQNSLDAQSNAIAVRVDLNNFSIQVVDNGLGIKEEDLKLIGTRYMTSKCHTIEDLQSHISTFGFRGEALCSLCDVCKRMVFVTRTEHSESTYSKVISEGKHSAVALVTPCRRGKGTTVTVEDFLFNMPIRRKRIKDIMDLEEIKTQLECLALVHPTVSFSLRNDATGVVCLQTRKHQDFLLSCSSILGIALTSFLLPLNYEVGKFKISGFISKENHTESTLQLVYVNRRIVSKCKVHKLLNILLKKSFHNINNVQNKRSTVPDVNLSLGEACVHYVYLINVECPYDCYDITFEPKKQLIEFENWEEVLICVKKAVKIVLKNDNFIVSETDVSKSQILEKPKKYGSPNPDFGTSQLVNAIRGAPVKRKSNAEESFLRDLSIREKTLNTVENPVLRELFGNSIVLSRKSSVHRSLKRKISEVRRSTMTGNRSLEVSVFQESLLVRKNVDLKGLSESPFPTSWSNKVLQVLDSEQSWKTFRKQFRNKKIKSSDKMPQVSFHELIAWLQCKAENDPSAFRLLKEFYTFKKNIKEPLPLLKTARKRLDPFPLQSIKEIRKRKLAEKIKNNKIYSPVCFSDTNVDGLIEGKRLNVCTQTTPNCFPFEEWFQYYKNKHECLKVVNKQHHCQNSTYMSLTNNSVIVKHRYGNESSIVRVQPGREESDHYSNYFTDRVNMNEKGQVLLDRTPNSGNEVARTLKWRNQSNLGLHNSFQVLRHIVPEVLRHEPEPPTALYNKHVHFTNDLADDCNGSLSLYKPIDFYGPALFDPLEEMCASEHELLDRQHFDFPLENQFPGLRDSFDALSTNQHKSDPHFEEICQKSEDPAIPHNSFVFNQAVDNNLFHDPQVLVQTSLSVHGSEPKLSDKTTQTEISLQMIAKPIHKSEHVQVTPSLLNSVSVGIQVKLPDSLNNTHSMVLVSPSIDSAENMEVDQSKDSMGKPIDGSNDQQSIVFPSPSIDSIENLQIGHGLESFVVSPLSMVQAIYSQDLKQCLLEEEYIPPNVGQEDSENTNLGNESRLQFVDLKLPYSSVLPVNSPVRQETEESPILRFSHQPYTTEKIQVLDSNPIELQDTAPVNTQLKENMLEICKEKEPEKKSAYLAFEPPFSSTILQSFKFTDRCTLVPKGLSPVLHVAYNKSTHLPNLTSLEQNQIDDAIGGTKDDVELSFLKWADDVSGKPILPGSLIDNLRRKATERLVFSELPIANAVVERSAVKVHQLTEPYNFSKDIFENIQVIGQLDKKFIVTLVSSNLTDKPHLLTLFDQHAVDERIRLEQLLTTYRLDDAFVSTTVEPIHLKFNSSKLRLIEKYKAEFLKLGINIKLEESDGVIVDGVPTCLWNKELRVVSSRINSTLSSSLEKLFTEVLATIRKTRGLPPNMPSVLHRVITTEACRGAIKFGQVLSMKDCTEMLQLLKFCDFPFQCAHGRPSLVPLVDLSLHSIKVTGNQALSFWKLKK